MTKRVLDVGNCVPDHAAIRGLLERGFKAHVSQTHGPEDTLELLSRESFDLVLINRKLDRDYSDGLDILKSIKADPRLASVPVMLITNFPEHQESAVAAGATYGFGKKELNDDATRKKLAEILT